MRDGRVALNGGAEVSSRYFGDVGSSSLRNAKGLASVRDPGRRLLAWRRVGQFGKDAPTRDQDNTLSSILRASLRVVSAWKRLSNDVIGFLPQTIAIYISSQTAALR